MSDLIRREEAIEMLQEAIDSYPPVMKGQGQTRNSTLEEAIDLIKSIPTAEPKVGKWIAKSFHECFCDNCGFSFDIMKCDFLENMKHCPNCGVQMERSE